MMTLLIDAALPARLDHRLDVALDRAQIARLQRADVDHHVDLERAVEDRAPRLVVLDVGASSRRAGTRRPSRRRRRVPRSSRAACRDPGRVDAHGREVELGGLAAQLLDLGPRRVRLEQRVVDHRRPRRRQRRRSRAARAATRPHRGRRAADPDSSRRATEWQAQRDEAGRGALRRDHFLGDDVDEPLEVLRIQHAWFNRRAARSSRRLDLQPAGGYTALPASACRARRRRSGWRRRHRSAASSRAS